ncbi:hypothetical protein J6590_050439 [Homalodisca vitripennis]|nr:hypothetical protein J6590_050439 [Homalodisca vitripennis]
MPHNGPRQGNPVSTRGVTKSDIKQHREVLPSRWPSAKLARPVDTEQTADNKINNETAISHPLGTTRSKPGSVKWEQRKGFLQ